MTLTEKIIALCPPDVFYNDLDKQALTLCLQTNKYVRRYKGNPCVPQDTRMTLEEHVYDLVHRFVTMPEVQHIIATADISSPAHRFVIQTLRTILRHDLGESIFEPQTYLQKMDPALPKIDAGYFESSVTALLYHLAQHAIISGRTTVFSDRIHALQKQYASFDVDASARTGQDYADYLYKNFDQAVLSLNQLIKELPPIADDATRLSIQQNNHWHHEDYERIENPTVQKTCPAGVFTKILDTAQLEDMAYEARKLENPALPYTHLSYQPNSYIFMLTHRAEKLLPLFTAMAQKEKFLVPFLQNAYDLTYTRVAAAALLLRPYGYLQPHLSPPEPGLACSGTDHENHNSHMAALIAARRATIHPLDDTDMLSNLEIAAKALCYRQLKPVVQKSIFSDAVPVDTAFRNLFDETLLALQEDQTLEARLALVNAICHQRLSFYR